MAIGGMRFEGLLTMHDIPMRITFILPYAGIAGGIRVIAIYAQHLKQRGHDVRVISTALPAHGRLARARQQFNSLLQRTRIIPQSPPDPSHFNGVDVAHTKIREARPVTDADVPDGDVVIATWWETAPWVAQLSTRKGVKMYFVQDYGAHEGQPMDQVAATWMLPLRKMAISKWLVRLIEEYSGDVDVDYVPNAVDPAKFHATPRGKQSRPTVGFLFNPSPQKGCDIIAQAVEIARKKVPDLQVVAFGPGQWRDAELPTNTRLLTCAPDDKLKDIYAQCDAWIFGSRSEGFGLPILEAMACRTPVIGTPAGAAPELLAEGGGILVKLDDPHDMAEAIVKVVRLSESSWRQMSDAAHFTASRFTWEDATTVFEDALRRELERNTRSRQPESMIAALGAP